MKDAEAFDARAAACQAADPMKRLNMGPALGRRAAFAPASGLRPQLRIMLSRWISSASLAKPNKPAICDDGLRAISRASPDA